MSPVPSPIEPKKTSPWAWVGVGCLVLAVLGVVAVIATVWLGARKVKEMTAEMADPVRRSTRVQEVLGASKIPDGYHAMMALSIPFLLDMAILSDREPTFGPDGAKGRAFDARGFVYVRMKLKGKGSGELRDWVDGKGKGPDALGRGSIKVDESESLRRGEVEVGGAKVAYHAMRGILKVEGNDVKGIVTIMAVGCPDGFPRLAIWLGPDPAPETSGPELDLTGTCGDEAAIAAFLGSFRLCG